MLVSCLSFRGSLHLGLSRTAIGGRLLQTDSTMQAPIRVIKYAFTKKEERDTAKTSHMTTGFYGHFPDVFGLYYEGEGRDFQSQNFYLGESPDSRLYSITFHRGPGVQQMTLYPSMERVLPPLAVTSNASRYGSGATLALPAPASNDLSTAPPRFEHLKSAFMGDTYTFSASVGLGSTLTVEEFIWREIRGRPTVRKLTRLKADDVSTLATWTEGTVPGRDGKVASCKFLDGAIAEFGDFWALMVVASALRICQAQWAALAGAEEWEKEKKISWYEGSEASQKE